MATLLESERLAFCAAQVEEQADKGRFARCPWGQSPSDWKSALQKAIRLGNVEKAQEAMGMLVLVPHSPFQSNVMNRIRTIFLEDVGIGCIGALPAVDLVLVAAEAARDRLFAKQQNAAVTDYRSAMMRLATFLANAPRKTRFLSHALGCFVKDSAKWARANVPELGIKIGSLEEEIRRKSVSALARVPNPLSAREASAIFDLCQRVAPQHRVLLAILQKWFKRGYSECELALYTAILVTALRDKKIFESMCVPVISADLVFVKISHAPPEPLDVVSGDHACSNPHH